MTKPEHRPLTFNLLQLPDDVQLSMLLAFDIRELIICRRMCRSLADLIDGDIYIQYKIELARSGRIDGAPSVAVMTTDRLTSLREHSAKFHANNLPLKRLRARPFGSMGALSSNGFVTTVSEGMVHLWQPAAFFSGIREHKVTRSTRELQLEGFGTGDCAVDVAQDLLVYSRKDLNTMTLTCFIYSLSNGRPHPAAARSNISLSFNPEDGPLDPWDSIQVLGDLIAWNVPDLHGRRCQMIVINWKTGITVWELHHNLWRRSRLISQSHVVLIMNDALLVYPIDRHLETEPAHSTSDTAQYVLQLPAWSSIHRSRSHLVRSYIQFPPPLAPDDRPFYCHDPDLTLLALHISYIVETPEDGFLFVQYAMFIPISTIKAACDGLAARPQVPGGSPSSRIVQWADWGRAGTRIVHFDSDSSCFLSAMGCSCAVTQRRRDASGNFNTYRTFVFDVHLWASPNFKNPSPNTPHWDLGLQQAEEARKRFVRDLTVEDTLAGSEFTESLRTTFPFDVTQKDILLTPEDRHPVIVLMEDGLLLVTSPT